MDKPTDQSTVNASGDVAYTCWACQTPLKRKQKICLECSSWQNWRKYLSISTATLSLLVALIAVTGSILPNLVRLSTRDFIKFELISGNVVYSRDNRATLRLKVANGGNISAITPLLVFCYHAVKPNNEANYVGLRAEGNFEFYTNDREVVQSNEIKTVEYLAGDLYHLQSGNEVESGALLCQFPYFDAKEESKSLDFIVVNDLVLDLAGGKIVLD